MKLKYEKTPEEEASGRLLEEIWEELSEAGRTIIVEAEQDSFDSECAINLYDSFAYWLDCYDATMRSMRLAAADLTDRDCELLRAHVRATIAAFASIDRYDHTLIEGQLSLAHLHQYYDRRWRMVDEILEYRKHRIRRQ